MTNNFSVKDRKIKERAVRRAINGEFEQALKDFNILAKLYPEDAQVYVNRGAVNYAIGIPQSAIEDFTLAIHLDPNCVEAYCSRGAVWQAIQNNELAVKDYSNAIQIAPTYYLPYLSLGTLQSDAGDFLPALKNLSQAVKLNPSCAKSYAYLGLTRKNLNDFKGAYADLSKAIELCACGNYYANRAVVGMLDPSISEADPFSDLSQASALFYREGDWMQAMAAMQAMQKFFPQAF